jgi:predicted transposase YbfD/YdcC
MDAVGDERDRRGHTAMPLPADRIGAIVRDHWAVENSLHWVMDMVFRDDECRLRIDHAPTNFTTIKHIALNLMRRGPGKDSLRRASRRRPSIGPSASPEHH